MLANIESMDSHIVIAGKHVDRSIGHLHINVGVPRQDLSDTVRLGLRGGLRVYTLPFHHQPNSVPCMIHVSAPMSNIEES